MAFLKRTTAVLVTACLCLGLLGGCGRDAAEEGFTLRAALVGEMPTGDPAMVTDPAGETLLLHLYENLMRPMPANTAGKSSAAEGAAKSYDEEENADGTVTYTFHLRDNARWSDGRKVRAEDFVYAWRRLVDPATSSPNHALLEMVQGYEEVRTTGDAAQLAVSAKSDTTLVVTVSYKCPYFLSDVCTAAATMPLRESATGTEGWAEDWSGLVTNGAYRAEEQSGESLTAVRNARYHGKDSGPQRIGFRFADSADEAWSLYQSGEADFTPQLPAAELEKRARSDSWSAIPGSETYCVLFNNAVEPLADPQVRQALSLAIDRGQISELTGTATTAAGALVPHGIPQSEEEDFRTAGGDLLTIEPGEASGDQMEAQRLLSQSGYAGGDTFPALEYLYVADDNAAAVAKAVRQMWHDVLRIDVMLKAVTQTELGEALSSGNYTLAAAPVGTRCHDAMGFLEHWETDAADNVLGYSNSAFDTLLAVIRSASDEAARFACLHDAEQLLLEDGALAPLYVTGSDWLLRESYSGAFWDGLGRFCFHSVAEASAGA